MTEPIQKELDELYEQLESEELHCNTCPDKGYAEACECCSVRGNINDLENMIRSLQE